MSMSNDGFQGRKVDDEQILTKAQTYSTTTGLYPLVSRPPLFPRAQMSKRISILLDLWQVAWKVTEIYAVTDGSKLSASENDASKT